MYQDIQSNTRLQSCPDCGVTICNCSNCHTMHCDSENLCSYLKTIVKMGNKKPDDPVASASILNTYRTNISVYTSKIGERYGTRAVTSLDDDLA